MPRERRVTDYYAVEYQTEYIPQVQYEKFTEYVPVERY
jgi:predicted nucleic acid-binding protein